MTGTTQQLAEEKRVLLNISKGWESMESEMLSASNFIKALAAGDIAILEKIHLRYRDDFIRWAASKFKPAEQNYLEDAWNDTLIMFYEQVTNRKLKHLSCTLKSYLFLIGFRRLRKIYKYDGKTDLMDDFDLDLIVDQSHASPEWDDDIEENTRMLNLAIQHLPKRCRQILIQKLIEGKTASEIFHSLGFKSGNSTSVTMSRCMKRLRDNMEHNKAEFRSQN